jgi:hypothetical protein
MSRQAYVCWRTDAAPHSAYMGRLGSGEATLVARACYAHRLEILICVFKLERVLTGHLDEITHSLARNQPERIHQSRNNRRIHGQDHS